MLSIGKLDQQMADYYERSVAGSREDYYALRGESPGVWWGRGGETLELRGTVEEGQLHRLVGFRDPANPTESLGRPAAGADKVGAYDLTFSAPKSVSILYALGSPEVQQAVVSAHDKAVREGLGYMEDHASAGRRGSASKGTLRPVEGDGFVAALYRHRVSRPVDMPDGGQRVDPQLHTHCIVANRTRSVEDGSWGALDGRHLYRLASTGGRAYQAALRNELTERLGVDWMPVVNGQADIPLRNLDALVAGFSSRREQIRAEATRQARDLMVRTDLMSAREAEQHIDADAAMRMLGTDGMRVATLASRQTKGGAEGSEIDLRQRWARQAAELGVTREDLAEPMGRVTAAREFVPRARPDRILGELTERVSTFTRHDAFRAVAGHAPLGATRAQLDRAVDELLADPVRVRTLSADRNGDVRYTTPEVQEAETRLVDTVRSRIGEGTGMITPSRVEEVLAARPELLTGNAEQGEMVRRLATGGAGVATVIGPAGTGKTRGLEAYVAAAAADGRHVVGAAFTGAAAELLEGETRAPSFTVHRLLGSWRKEPMPGGAVVIVDEAGQLNRPLTGELVELAARDRTKLILAGDPKQMQPMDSGGPFRVIDRFTPATDSIELSVNRRQRDVAERRLLSLVRAGETREAVEGYMRHGQIVETPDGVEVRMRMIADWWDAYRSGKDTLLLGRRHVDVDLLNGMARQRCVEAGMVSGPAIDHQGRTFQAGDQLVCLRNDNRRNGVHVRNGMRGRIDETDLIGGRVHVAFRGGQERWIPLDSYPDVAHGWAMTVEKAQGQTVDCAFVMRPAAAGNEWHYTALSRGREPVKYYLVSRPADRDVEGTGHAGEREDGRSTSEVLAGQWRRSDAAELSVEFPDCPDRCPNAEGGATGLTEVPPSPKVHLDATEPHEGTARGSEPISAAADTGTEQLPRPCTEVAPGSESDLVNDGQRSASASAEPVGESEDVGRLTAWPAPERNADDTRDRSESTSLPDQLTPEIGTEDASEASEEGSKDAATFDEQLRSEQAELDAEDLARGGEDDVSEVAVEMGSALGDRGEDRPQPPRTPDGEVARDTQENDREDEAELAREIEVL